MTNIHEEYGYEDPSPSNVIYLGIFEHDGAWKAALKTTGKGPGAETFDPPHTAYTLISLPSMTAMACSTLEYEGMAGLVETETHPLVDLVFHHLKTAGVHAPNNQDQLKQGIDRLVTKGLINNENRASLEEILVAHRKLWPDNRPTVFYDGRLTGPTAPAAPSAANRSGQARPS